MDTLNQCQELTASIQTAIMHRRDHLAATNAEISKLKEAGVFDDIPTESWESRNGGEGRYLRLVFPTQNRRRRRVYVGSDPVKIEEAQAKIKRTQQLRDLQAEQRRITDHLHRAKARLQDALNALEGKKRW